MELGSPHPQFVLATLSKPMSHRPYAEPRQKQDRENENRHYDRHCQEHQKYSDDSNRPLMRELANILKELKHLSSPPFFA